MEKIKGLGRSLAILLQLGLLIAGCAALLAIARPVLAAPAGANDAADLKRVESYLNTLQSFRARILQLNPDGTTIGGQLSIQRPGKLRLDYDAPAKSFIIADGSFVHYWDDQLQQTSSVPEGDSPAALILRAQVDFSADPKKSGMTVTDVTRGPGELELTMFKTDDPASGKLTLVFEDNPLRLRQWRVKDQQSAITRVTLQNLETGASFDRDLFQYRPPSFDKSKKN